VFISETLESYGYLKKNEPIDAELAKRIEYAFNWVRDFEEIKETPMTLLQEERNAITALISTLEAETDPDKIQNAIFNSAKNNGLQPRAFFKTLYTILLGVPQGPRLGSYMLAMGRKNVIEALQRALTKSS
jgi:lysyl-tRNA synthetase class 1